MPPSPKAGILDGPLLDAPVPPAPPHTHTRARADGAVLLFDSLYETIASLLPFFRFEAYFFSR